MRLWLLVCVLVLGTSVQASAQQNFPWKSFDVFDFSDGLNDGSDPVALKLGEASDLQNVVFTTSSAIKKREGFSRINTSASPDSTSATVGGTMYRQSDGDRFLVRVVNNGATDVIHKMDYGSGTSGPDGTWDNITGALSFSIDDDAQGDFAQAFDTLIIEDGLNSTAPFKWSGSGNAEALGGSPPEATMVEYHRNHLWSAGDTDNRSRVTFSNICTTSSTCLETYTATDFFEIETNDGQVVTAIQSSLDCLYIWKTQSIFRICGTSRDNFTQEQMVKDIGTISANSVVVINNQFIFKTHLGDYALYDGGVNVTILSTRIEGSLASLNLNRIDAVRAVAFDDGTGDQDYYACETQTGGSKHNRVFVYDTFHQSWTKFKGIDCNAIWSFEVGTFETAIAFGDYAGFVNRYPDTDADAGAAIDAFWQSGQWRVPEIPLRKTFRVIQVFVSQEGNFNLTFIHKLDFEATGTSTSISLAGSGSLYDTAVFDSDTYGDLTTNIARIEINDGDYFLQYRFEQAGINEPFTVKGVRTWLESTQRE